MLRRLAILSAMAIAVSACSEAGPQAPTAEQQMAARAISDQRVSPSAIRLADGTCIDASRLVSPWVQETEVSQNIISIAAPGKAINVAPYERDSYHESFDGKPHDGKVRVSLSRGPWDDGGAYTTLAIAERSANEGYLKRSTPWGNETNLVAYSGVGDPKYVNSQDTIRCRDYSTHISCQFETADSQVSFGVSFNATERSRLPEVLQIITTAVEATRGPCPSSAVKATS